MATFSLGSGITPGAPGVYINEQAGRAAAADLADFSTVYMLVETEEQVSVSQFPYNTPTAITSLNDYKELIRIGTATVPESRIPLLSYNCVDEFFQNAQVGDLRVVRVGTPNQIVEVEFLPSGTKIGNSGTPSSLVAGDTVYMQIVINGQKLVAGDGATGYDAAGNWLGVPVTVPVSYVAGDLVNNRRISSAMVAAAVAAIESNPAINNSVYIRNYGLLSDLDSASTSDSGYLTLASSAFAGEVSLLTEVTPVGSTSVFMNNSYQIENIVGGTVNLTRVPQDYTQCISTAFDGQQDQGYLIAPTAYAQFNAEGRAQVGTAAAAHCASNNFKWMAIADPGPYFVTSINEYTNFSAHKAAANLTTSSKYLINNGIYEWTGTDVTYPKLKYQSVVFGDSAKTAVNESSNLVSDATKVGLLDSASYSITSAASAANGVFPLSTETYWPVTLPIQKVTLSGVTTGSDFTNVNIQGGATGISLSGSEVYIVAAPADIADSGDYPLNQVLIATTPTDASNIYNAVLIAGGTSKLVAPPAGAVFVAAPTSSVATISYNTPYWDLPAEIKGQTSDLIQNVSGAAAGVNTLHLPATLQDSTAEYALNWVSRTFLTPQTQVTASVGLSALAALPIKNGSAIFACLKHGLRDGQKIFFTAPIVAEVAGVKTNIVSATSKTVNLPYWVRVVSEDSFTLANSLANYSVGNYITIPTGVSPATDILPVPTTFYSQVTGRGLADLSSSSAELTSLPLIRARKYSFDSNSIWNQALDAATAPAGAVAGTPGASIYLNNSSTILGEKQIAPFGEDLTSSTKCDWLPKLNLVDPTTSSTSALNNAFCVPTVDQAYQGESYMVPAIEAVLLGEYDASAIATIGPILQFGITPTGDATLADGTYNGVELTGGTGTGATATIELSAGNVVNAFVEDGGVSYTLNDALTLPTGYGTNSLTVVHVAGIGGAVDSIASTPGTAGVKPDGDYAGVVPVLSGGSSQGSGLVITVTMLAGQVSAVAIENAGKDYITGTTFSLPTGQDFPADAIITATVTGGSGAIASVAGAYAGALAGSGIVAGAGRVQIQDNIADLVGTYFDVTGNGFTPDEKTAVVVGDRMAVVSTGANTYGWVVVAADSLGGDMSTVARPAYGSQVQMLYTAEQGVPSNLWRFDAITVTELIDDALRGVGFNGVPQAKLIEAGVDNVNRLLEDSQRYFNPFGFIAFYGSYIKNGAGSFIPPSPYVTGVALRRYRAEGYQFPPAGVKYQLADAVGVQIPINSAQQNLLNPKGCNAVRTLPGYPQNSVFIWGGRTRVNENDAQQRLYQFVNTRVILNVVYGSLRNAFDTQIFNVIDGFGVIFNQIISVGNSVLNQLYVRGALFGSRPSDAFQVICDARINPPEDTENGIVNAKVFVTPVPALERIQIDLIRVAVGQMQNELGAQGLNQNQ